MKYDVAQFVWDVALHGSGRQLSIAHDSESAGALRNQHPNIRKEGQTPAPLEPAHHGVHLERPGLGMDHFQRVSRERELASVPGFLSDATSRPANKVISTRVLIGDPVLVRWPTPDAAECDE